MVDTVKMQGIYTLELQYVYNVVINAIVDHPRQHILSSLLGGENHVKNGFDFGTIIFQNEKNTYTVLYQNENLIAWSSNKEQPLAIGPDSICYVTESGLTFSNDDIEFYKKQLKEDKETVYIVGVKAQRQLRGEKIMESFNQALSDMGYYGSNTNT